MNEIKSEALPPTGEAAGAAAVGGDRRFVGFTCGVALAGGIGAVAILTRLLPIVSLLSPMIIAMALGVGLRQVLGAPTFVKPGVVFCMRNVLRFAVVLLGLQLTAAQLAALGGPMVVVLIVVCAASFWFIKWAGKLIGVDERLAELIAAGTSICGASAVVAMNSVTRGSEEDAAYAVACVTVFGSIAVLLYPLAPALLHMDARAYGLWTGASIHEIAQVFAAAFQHGTEAGNFGTIAKLTRVMMLAPMVLGVAALAHVRRSRGAPAANNLSIPLPWFVVGFIVMVAFNSIVGVPAAVGELLPVTTAFLLAAALAAMGLEMDLSKLRARGLRPVALGAIASIFIAALSLLLVRLFAW